MSFVKGEWSCGGGFGGAWFVEGAVAEHREEHADPLSGEAEESLCVGLSAGSAAVVVGAGGGVVQGGERGEKHRAFELPVSASGCVLAVDRSPRRPCCRGEAGVGGEVGGGGKAGAVADGDQQGGGGPDRDPRHRGQDRGKRVGVQQLPDLRFRCRTTHPPERGSCPAGQGVGAVCAHPRCRPAAHKWPGIALGRAVVGPLIRVSNGTPRAR